MRAVGTHHVGCTIHTFPQHVNVAAQLAYMVGDLLFVPCEQAGFTSAQGLDASPRPGAADRDQENLTELELCESLRGHVCEVRMVRADHVVHHRWRDIDLGQPP